MKTHTLPLVKLPQAIDEILYMIREDLKSQKYFNTVSSVTDGYCPYQPHLGKLILIKMKLDDGSDEIFDFYYKLVEKRSKKIGSDNNSIMKQVMKVYLELVMEKELRKIEAETGNKN